MHWAEERRGEEGRLLHRPGSSGGSSSSWDVSTSGEYWVVSQSQPVTSVLALQMTLTKDNRSKEKEAGEDDDQEKISYAKVVILGASGVGKTSIIKVLATQNILCSDWTISVLFCLIPSLLV